eukprot:TRINITY_DN17631_c1_g1_i3.p1 TRINITY_DN17631_c1_g1~~TRINITY_DN17631_c1_g1_i3.p1  ORF type:complete len:182 (-),score=3.36 TRINITY_DN17631_c1_g1_i3:39-584(-)
MQIFECHRQNGLQVTRTNHTTKKEKIMVTLYNQVPDSNLNFINYNKQPQVKHSTKFALKTQDEPIPVKMQCNLKNLAQNTKYSIAVSKNRMTNLGRVHYSDFYRVENDLQQQLIVSSQTRTSKVFNTTICSTVVTTSLSNKIKISNFDNFNALQICRNFFERKYFHAIFQQLENLHFSELL